MASAPVLWFGEAMSAVPLRNNKAAVSAARSVTVLGATGSIGDSTMDLLRAAGYLKVSMVGLEKSK